MFVVMEDVLGQVIHRHASSGQTCCPVWQRAHCRLRAAAAATLSKPQATTVVKKIDIFRTTRSLVAASFQLAVIDHDPQVGNSRPQTSGDQFSGIAGICSSFTVS